MRSLSLVLLLSSTVLTGQSTPPPDMHPDKQRVVEEVLRKRDDMREGKTDRYNVRVRVKLKNGAKLTGVVKNGRLVEREEGIDFVETDRQSPDAGIRLYYFDETTSFVFLRWADIAQHKVVLRLTDEEVRAIEKEFADRERKRQELRSQLATPTALPGGRAGDGDKPGDPPPPGKPPDKAGAKPDDKPAMPAAGALLTEFPPSEGWGEDKVKQIQQRKIAVGAYPNAKEKRFLEVYEEWKQQAAAAKAPGGAETPKPAGSSDR